MRNRATFPQHDLTKTSKSITLAANNTTESIDVFQITGTVLFHGIWGVVTTAIGANHTAGHLRVDDGTAQTDVTESATGATLSSFAVGSLVLKERLDDVALKVMNANAARYDEPLSTGTLHLQQFTIVQKEDTGTHIEYRYTTTDTPTSGVILWTCQWEPLSIGGVVTPA